MQQRPVISLSVLFWLPIGLLLRMSPWSAIGLIFAISVLCWSLYYSLNSDFFGLAAPPFSKITFSADYRQVTMPDGHVWRIIYEKDTFSVFTGVAREVIHWRDEQQFPFATHDILVTNGEYSSPTQVTARVQNHAVYYEWYTDRLPQGTINLLHIIPLDEEIYRQLLQIRRWNVVTIKGREILRIENFNPLGTPVVYFQDAGCNTILVTAVTILAQGTPIP
ncbi:MAG: hypothetical protein DDG60_08870 [Anaerolineae bacterium]|nr:MAG: hypothetical protein DDG60_08870 [Anaerolineae bacterium]